MKHNFFKFLKGHRLSEFSYNLIFVGVKLVHAFTITEKELDNLIIIFQSRKRNEITMQHVL